MSDKPVGEVNNHNKKNSEDYSFKSNSAQDDLRMNFLLSDFVKKRPVFFAQMKSGIQQRRVTLMAYFNTLGLRFSFQGKLGLILIISASIHTVIV